MIITNPIFLNTHSTAHCLCLDGSVRKSAKSPSAIWFLILQSCDTVINRLISSSACCKNIWGTIYFRKNMGEIPIYSRFVRIFLNKQIAYIAGHNSNHCDNQENSNNDWIHCVFIPDLKSKFCTGKCRNWLLILGIPVESNWPLSWNRFVDL